MDLSGMRCMPVIPSSLYMTLISMLSTSSRASKEPHSQDGSYISRHNADSFTTAAARQLALQLIHFGLERLYHVP